MPSFQKREGNKDETPTIHKKGRGSNEINASLAMGLERVSDDIDAAGRFLEALFPAVSHPSAEVRKLACQKLKEREESFGYRKENDNVFDLMLAVEEDPILFENFRERAKRLRCLRYDYLQQFLPDKNIQQLEMLVFRFILAQYFENLTDYWPLVTEIASTFARCQNIDALWSCFESMLIYANANIYENKAPAVNLPDLNDRATCEEFQRICSESEKRTSFCSFRLEMFHLMSDKFVWVAERKHRYLVQNIFDVYENEFQCVTVKVRRYDDITSAAWYAALQSNEEDDEDTKVTPDNSTEKLDRSLVKKTLVAQMGVFARFSNLRSAYKATELCTLFNELLRANDIQLQKAALACVFNFKKKELELYRKHFDNLVEENLFRSELLHFSVDDENTVLADADRSAVIPVLLNLLMGKMQTKTTKNIPRRPLVFRFVAGCRPEELELFLKTIFSSVDDQIDSTSIRQTCRQIAASYDPTKTVALSRVSELLSCLGEVFTKLSRSLHELQNAYVFQVTISCHLLIRLGLENAQTSPHFRKILRNLRAQAFDLLGSMFNVFQHREFNADELNVLFDECIRPYLSEQDSSSDLPWSILRFFGRLTEIPRFYPLLNVPIFETADSPTPMDFLCDVLFSSALTPENRNFVVERILNLLTFFHEDSLAKLPSIRQHTLVSRENDDRPFGTRLIINHVPRLLAYLKDALSQEIRSRSPTTMNHFALLEKISEFSNDPTLGAEFATTLLPFVEAGHFQDDDRLAAVLVSIGNFLTHDHHPETYFSRIAPFLSEFRARKVREALVQLLRGLKSNRGLSEQLKNHIERLEQLEAWHPHRINELDYERRHETMAELSRMYESPRLSAEIPFSAIRSYIHSHFFSLLRVDELSIRSSSSNCLRLLIRLLKSHTAKDVWEKERTQQLIEEFLVLTARSIKSRNESVRHEIVHLLVCMIDEFGSTLEVLMSLRQLRNAEDSDQCFFENVAHLQLYRRQRAFQRLGTSLENNEVELPLETLDKFVTPLVQPYLLQIESKLMPLSDEAIRLFSIMMHKQPWAVYHRILNFYIDGVNREVENNKPYIRVLNAVLGAFHFDVANVSLSNGPSGDYTKTDRERFKHLSDSIKRQRAKRTKRRQFMSFTDVKSKIKLSERLPNLIELNDEEKEKSLSSEQRILTTVLRVVIPRLRKCIQAPQEFHAHKKAQQGDKYFADEEEINRAPIAVATIKLLQKLPPWAMDMHLQGIVFTVLHLLLSRSYIVREAARKSMEQIVKTLGPSYLPIALNDLRQNLTRGYQIHVMIFTVHSLVSCLQSEMQPGDLDESFEDIFEVVKDQQFGQVDDEQQANATKSKTPEAKSNKTYETFVLLGRFISDESLDKFVEPMREIIDNSPKIETYKKLRELLRALSQGLRLNKGISPVVLLDFSRTLLAQYIEEMSRQHDALRAQEVQEKQEREAGYRPQHSLLLMVEPKRVGAIVNTSSRSKASVFVEFGLQLLGDVLSEKHFKNESKEDVEFLNPYLHLVLNALRLKYEKTTALALRVLIILLKYPLLSIQEKMSAIVDRLFILLNEYANASGTTKLNVNELNQHLFKAVVTVLRQAPEELLTKRRLQILLNHVEVDLLDPHKQSTAFTLAKAIVSRHMQNEKIGELVKYLAELSITSPIEQIRIQARATIQTYFRSHPSDIASVEKWLLFFLEQLDYEFVHGRLSALESINALFRLSNKDIVDKYGFSTFVRLASRFLEDDDLDCHRFVSTAMREVILKVSTSVRGDIYLALKDWIESKKPGPRYIGVRAMCEVAKVSEFQLSDECVKSILTNIVGRYFAPNMDEGKIDENELEVALTLFTELIRNRLELVKKALNKAPNLQRTVIERLPDLLTISDTESVCFKAASFLEHLLASTRSIWPLLSKFADLPELCGRCIQQLAVPAPSDLFAEEAIKNLVTLSVQINEEEFDTVCRRLSVLPKFEIKNESGITKRLCLFKFMAAQLVHFNADDNRFQSLVDHFGSFLFREFSGKSTKDAEQLLQIATELASILREKVGETEFNTLLSRYHVKSDQKQRKRERNELLIVDQQLATRLKQKSNQRKSQAKKRKLDQQKPYRIAKRRRREEIQRTGEIE